MRRQRRERFPGHRLKKKPLVSYPGKHHGTYVTAIWQEAHEESVPGACATRNFTYLTGGPYANTAIVLNSHRRFAAFCGLYKSFSRISNRTWHWSIHVIGPVPVQYPWRIWTSKLQHSLKTFTTITAQSWRWHWHYHMNMVYFVTLLCEKIQHNTSAALNA